MPRKSASAGAGLAVHGLGGVGKTELALQYAHTYSERLSPLWWIDASTADDGTAGLAALARDAGTLVAAAPTANRETDVER